jgi:hypothetical protein
MKRMSRIAVGTLAVVVCSTAFAPAARAGCAEPSDGIRPGAPAYRLQQAGNRPVSLVFDRDGDFDDAAIVGLWQVTFVSKGTAGIPDSTVIDAGYATWHSDGTELMNSSRPPITSNFCMGVWKQVGRSTFRLNHVALSWDPSGVNFVGPANIKEQVTVDQTGNRYRGTFTIDQFDAVGNTLAHVVGEVTGRRITVE